MNVLVAEIDAGPVRGISDALDRFGYLTCTFYAEEDILQALSFARFDAMVVDLDAASCRVIEIIKAHRCSAGGEGMLPVIGLASKVTPLLQRVKGDGVVDRLLPKPLDPAELHDVLSLVGRLLGG